MARSPGSGERIFCYIDARDYLLFESSVRTLETYWPKLTLQQTINIAKFIQKSAKLRAPRASGYLADHIYVTATKQNEISIIADAYYAKYQEQGYTPHYVSTYNHLSLYVWALMRGHNPPAPVYFVSGYKPFLSPAVDAAESRMGEWYGKSTTRAVKYSFGKMRKPE
jgi:hypothetical protein